MTSKRQCTHPIYKDLGPPTHYFPDLGPDGPFRYDSPVAKVEKIPDPIPYEAREKYLKLLIERITPENRELYEENMMENMRLFLDLELGESQSDIKEILLKMNPGRCEQCGLFGGHPEDYRCNRLTLIATNFFYYPPTTYLFDLHFTLYFSNDKIENADLLDSDDEDTKNMKRICKLFWDIKYAKRDLHSLENGKETWGYVDFKEMKDMVRLDKNVVASYKFVPESIILKFERLVDTFNDRISILEKGPTKKEYYISRGMPYKETSFVIQ